MTGQIIGFYFFSSFSEVPELDFLFFSFLVSSNESFSRQVVKMTHPINDSFKPELQNMEKIERFVTLLSEGNENDSKIR